MLILKVGDLFVYWLGKSSTSTGGVGGISLDYVSVPHPKVGLRAHTAPWPRNRTEA